MARKTLLTESEIRQFMKLAELSPIGDQRIQEMGGYMPGARDDEEDREEEDPAGESLEEEEMELDMELGDEEEAPAMDLDEPEMDMDAEMGADEPKMVAVDDFMGALEAALEDVLGEPVSTEMDMDDDAPEDMGAPEEDDLGDLGAEMGAEDEEDEPAPPMMEEEDIVAEIARRVVARLQEQKNKKELVDTLAERIMKRLTK